MLTYNCFHLGYPMYFPIAAVGCPDVPPPPGAWAKREEDNLVIRCNNTGETWYLTCKDEEWIGEYNDCTGKHARGSSVGNKNFLQKGKTWHHANKCEPCLTKTGL